MARDSPGYMLTKLTKTILAHDTELKKTWESLTPMGRMGNPEDLAVRHVRYSANRRTDMRGRARSCSLAATRRAS